MRAITNTAALITCGRSELAPDTRRLPDRSLGSQPEVASPREYRGMADSEEVWAGLAAADNDHDTSRYSTWLADNVIVHLPGGGHTGGIAAYRDFIESLFVGLPDYHAEANEVMSQGESVFVHFTITGTHSGELFGIPATGRAVQYQGCSLWHVATRNSVHGGTSLFTDHAAQKIASSKRSEAATPRSCLALS